MRTALKSVSCLRRATPKLAVTMRPTKPDLAVPRAIARKAGAAPQRLARALTWCADEIVLCVLAAVGWLASRGRDEPLRRAGNHAVLVALAASLLPNGMKLLVDQTRPDRMTVFGHVHGISFSGKREDAFPSGHALHMGALASAAGALRAGPRRIVQTLAIGLSLMRVVVLAHWASDVVAGFAVGPRWGDSLVLGPAFRAKSPRTMSMPILDDLLHRPKLVPPCGSPSTFGSNAG
jgi:membrane-associated phospholipid phosphatase